MTGLLGVFLSLALLMVLAYRGVSVIVLAPALAALAVVMDGDSPVLAGYTQVFMGALGTFITRYFPLFLLGALLGKLMEDSGSARAIARAVARWIGTRRAIPATVLSCAALTYGGVSLFVVAFAVYPLAAAMFREANIPKRLIPGTIALGSFTFSMSCLPGSPQIQNLIPMPYFNTTAFAAPVVGLLAGAAILALGLIWLTRRAGKAARIGEGYGVVSIPEAHKVPGEPGVTPPLSIAVIPIIAVIALNYALSEHFIPAWDTGYLSETKYGATDLGKVRGLWSMILSLTAACVLAAALNYRSTTRLTRVVGEGAMGSLLPIFNTASEVGYGATIASLPAFAAVKQAVVNVSPNPLVSEVIAVNVLAGITGSASGGLSMAMEALGATYARLAAEAGISPDWMHRVAAMSAGGLDTLPHNGAVITLLTICGLTHRQSYLDIGIVSLAIPILVTGATVATLTSIA